MYKIEKILDVEPNAFNGLTKVTFMVAEEPKQIYMFCKPQNEPKVGTDLEGSYAPDKAGKFKFTKVKKEYGGYNAPNDSTSASKLPVNFATPAVETISWGQAVIAASMLSKDNDYDKVIELARKLYKSEPDDYASKDTIVQADEINHTEQIDLSRIPF
jgi:hypothetical protein